MQELTQSITSETSERSNISP